MIMLKYESIILTFCILHQFVSRYVIEGAAINEPNHACSLREWGCDNGECISFEKRCDGEVTCSDGSDEAVELCSAESFGLEEGGSFSDVLLRTKRQSSGCRSDQWSCVNGSCIELSQVCNGAKDCHDGSDETLIKCSSTTCALHLFRCSYGACVDSGSDCNGRVDCVDGSDERPELCNKSPGPVVTRRLRSTEKPDSSSSSELMCILPPYPPHGKYQETSGGEPGSLVPYASLSYSCDEGYILSGDNFSFCIMGTWNPIQQPSCENSPDLIRGAAIIENNQTCRTAQFQCLNGQCIDVDGKCNGQKDCSDGSDENQATCRKNISSKQMCVLPPYPPHGKYEDDNGALPGSVVSDAFLLYSCDKGFNLNGDSSSYCILGKWMGETPTCESQCKLPRSTSVDFTCDVQFPHLNYTLEVSCNFLQENNAVVKAKCKDLYDLNPPPRDLHCVNGNWDYIPSCQPVSPDVTEGAAIIESNQTCRTEEFQCLDGQCIDLDSICDGQKDCSDGSDETQATCGRNTKLKPINCVLPPYPPHGKYNELNGDRPGSVVNYTSLSFSCDKGYTLSGDKYLKCFEGNWDGLTPICKPQCTPLKSTSVHFTCYRPYSNLRYPCNTSQEDNTVAKAKCKDSYDLNPPPRDLHCLHGSWDYMPSCQRECGVVAPKGQTLVINGVDAIASEFPWHVGLYDKSENPPNQICGGSIFHSNLVVTAAHCIYKDRVGLYPASTFAVAAGKLYRRWNAPRDDEQYIQKKNVIEIKIPDRYKGAINAYTSDIAILILESSFVFNSFVRPICINFNFQGSLQGLSGRVAGWGLTAEDGRPSSSLKTVALPFISFEDCYTNSPESFRPLITTDKICAGYRNGTALCKGDSGGGLVFNLKNGFKDKYYLFGIVSTSPRNEALTSCRAFAYTAFTGITDKYIQAFFNDTWSTYSTIS